MRKRFISIFLMLVLVLSACTTNEENKKEDTKEVDHSQLTQKVDVEIMLPEKINPQKESVLRVKVTQGSENVVDADEVEFEIWKPDKKNESEMIKATHEKEGIYRIEKTFEDQGLYYVQTHVTARGMHVMPVKLFVVGEATKEQLEELKKAEEQSKDHDESDEHSDSHDHH